LELVDKFCYLGDMLSVDGDADAAVEARIRIGWNKFRQLVPVNFEGGGGEEKSLTPPISPLGGHGTPKFFRLGGIAGLYINAKFYAPT